MQRLGDGEAAIEELREHDLRCGGQPGVMRRFRAQLTAVNVRMTHQDVAWAVLTFSWPSGRSLRGAMFPTPWAQSPDLVVGRVYWVVGSVEFRDRAAVIRVLTVQESLRLFGGEAD